MKYTNFKKLFKELLKNSKNGVFFSHNGFIGIESPGYYGVGYAFCPGEFSTNFQILARHLEVMIKEWDTLLSEEIDFYWEEDLLRASFDKKIEYSFNALEASENPPAIRKDIPLEADYLQACINLIKNEYGDSSGDSPVVSHVSWGAPDSYFATDGVTLIRTKTPFISFLCSAPNYINPKSFKNFYTAEGNFYATGVIDFVYMPSERLKSHLVGIEYMGNAFSKNKEKTKFVVLSHGIPEEFKFHPNTLKTAQTLTKSNVLYFTEIQSLNRVITIAHMENEEVQVVFALA